MILEFGICRGPENHPLTKRHSTFIISHKKKFLLIGLSQFLDNHLLTGCSWFLQQLQLRENMSQQGTH